MCLKKYEKTFARIGGKWKRSEEQKMRTDSENLKKTKYFIFDFFEIQSEQTLISPRQIQLLSCQGFFCQPKKRYEKLKESPLLM